MGYLIRSNLLTRLEEGCIQHDMIKSAIKTRLNSVYTDGCGLSYTTQFVYSCNLVYQQYNEMSLVVNAADL